MKIGVIGHFGGNKGFSDGQTIKTQSLYKALANQSDVQLTFADTYYIKHRPFCFLYQFLKVLLFNRRIIVLVSRKGRKFLFPVFYYAGKYMGKRIYHYAIGGRLAREASQSRKTKKYVNGFAENWVESRKLTEMLYDVGVENAVYIPNFKKLNILRKQDIIPYTSSVYRFCTFSRVMEQKGIDDAIHAIETINREYGYDIATLDIYGPIDPEYQKDFDAMLRDNRHCAYRGVIPAEESVDTLKDYFALLFPTHWRHEGIPGTIIDALSAGVPVIARKWQYCDEMITDGETGVVYSFDDPAAIVTSICFAIDHPDIMNIMKKACVIKAEEYSEETVIKSILERIR